MCAACNIYISEGKDTSILDKIQSVPKQKSDVILGNVFIDETYNRTGLTVVGKTVQSIVNVAVDVADMALSLIDLTMHKATHPRLGVVDHISCHPLTPPHVPLEMASDAARGIAERLGSGERAVPVYIYGHASRGLDASLGNKDGEIGLADIRRHFSYFSANEEESWEGCIQEDEYLASFPPACGPLHVHPQRGIACVGSVPWVVNHNVLLDTRDVTVAKGIARLVRETGGGLKSVQAMGLVAKDGVEVACNLLDENVSSPAKVDKMIRQLATERGIKVLNSYQTGKSVHDLLRLQDVWMNIDERV